MPYRIKVQAPIDRARDLAAGADIKDADFLSYYNFRDELSRLPLVRVSIDLPIYRMGNFRTQRQQLHYARSHEQLETFFESGEEDEGVQQIQHEFLWALAQEGQGESVVAVSTVLQQDGQKEPLLVTSSGVVVNGNRRLAAMRELSLKKLGHDFAFVKVAVLPRHANENDLIRIEVREQMQRETKLPYGWVNDALAIRKMQAKSFTKLWIKDEMHLSSPVDVDDKVGALEAAETYLSERDEVDNWEKVDGQEQLFKDGYKSLKNRSSDAGEREAVRSVLHAIADKPREFGARSYEYMAPFKDNAPRLLSMLAAQLGIDEDKSDEVINDDALLVPVGVGGSAPEVMTALKEALTEGEGDSIRATIKQVVDSFKAAKNEQQAGEQALAHARKANSEVTLIDLLGARKDTFVQLGEQLTLISRRCERLLQQIGGDHSP